MMMINNIANLKQRKKKMYNVHFITLIYILKYLFSKHTIFFITISTSSFTFSSASSSVDDYQKRTNRSLHSQTYWACKLPHSQHPNYPTDSKNCYSCTDKYCLMDHWVHSVLTAYLDSDWEWSENEFQEEECVPFRVSMYLFICSTF